ncbi:MAG: hypothetical protein ACK59Y_14275 [Betaproteobacteria bacterium]
MLMMCLLSAGIASAQTQKPPVVPATPGLGRLFFTPEQRDQLDLLRLKKVAATHSRDEAPPEVVSYEGIVRRSDGGVTVWVNNKALTEPELRQAQSIAGRVERDGRLILRPAQGAPQNALRLKVGQRAEMSSGKVEERPANDTRNATAAQHKSVTEAKPRDAELKPVSAARGPIPEKLPVLGEGDQVKYVPLDPAMAAKLKAAQEDSREKQN